MLPETCTGPSASSAPSGPVTTTCTCRADTGSLKTSVTSGAEETTASGAGVLPTSEVWARAGDALPSVEEAATSSTRSTDEGTDEARPEQGRRMRSGSHPARGSTGVLTPGTHVRRTRAGT